MTAIMKCNEPKFHRRNCGSKRAFEFGGTRFKFSDLNVESRKTSILLSGKVKLFSVQTKCQTNGSRCRSRERFATHTLHERVALLQKFVRNDFETAELEVELVQTAEFG